MSTARGRADPGVTALVLAGGSARRFGSDKLVAPLDGGRVLDGALAAARTVAERVLLAGPARLAGDVEVIGDALPSGHRRSQHPRFGPLGAIVAGLEAATTPLLAVIAGDMPRARSDVLAHLAAAWCGEVAVVPIADGVAQPLHAIWAVEHAAAVRAAFDTGVRSPARVCTDLGAAFVSVDAGPAGWAWDVDTTADLDALRRPTT